MLDASTCRFLDWDSSHFGLRIGRVMPAETAEDPHLREALQWADSLSMDCMYLLLNSGARSRIRLASSLGWRMVDIRVTLSARLSDLAQGAPGVRHANPDDIPCLMEVARRSHRDSRFYADGNFPVAACDELFAKWIERSILDRSFAGAVLVPEAEGQNPTGYVSCSIQEGVGQIGLLAVDEKARGQGVGTSLLAESAKWFAAQRAERVSVATQGSNIPALRMYQRFGFSVESVQLWFHWWRERNS